MHAWAQWLDLVFPRACALCASPLVEPRDRGMCSRCASDLAPIENGCMRCGAPARDKPWLSKSSSTGKRAKRKRPKCDVCEKSRFEMTRVFAFTIYSGAAIRVARKMKEPQFEPLAHQMGRALAEWLVHSTPFAVEHYDAIVPIPQHWFRRLTLRYNQSEALAAGVSASVRCPIQGHWIQRTRWTPKQGMKTIAERLENMHRAFEIPEKYAPEIQGRRFLLVDDVMTSGATLDQAAWALKQRGAILVDAAVFARGLGVAKPPASPPSPPQIFTQIPRTQSAETA